VLQNLEKPTWFNKTKKIVLGIGFFHFLRILPKKGFFRLFSAKIGPFATFSIYSESTQKTLPENIHFIELWIIRENLGGKLGGAERHSVYSEKNKKNDLG
jgi:hypothetical protein